MKNSAPAPRDSVLRNSDIRYFEDQTINKMND